MSLRSSAARSLQSYSGDVTLNEMQQARDDLSRKVGANPLANSARLDGLLQSNGSTSDGIQFDATGGTNASRELAHGLDRVVSHFIVTDMQTAVGTFKRSAVTVGLERTHIKLTNIGASACYAKFVVF